METQSSERTRGNRLTAPPANANTASNDRPSPAAGAPRTERKKCTAKLPKDNSDDDDDHDDKNIQVLALHVWLTSLPGRRGRPPTT
ncbi:hypothetical protein AAFF_G00167300 [Aldrovandia affinis]|uniref:Uncharacterized protein n=1 Tax=Aldrovandia affinis TaxID=143900 RepID=A0AAD7RPU2_9TELE|nr:hypothetical protein AAFF_G00167300 [Aldrovandia affinis]